MRKIMFLLALFLFTGMQLVQAQKTVTGKITDAKDGSGIPGVTVLVKGTTIGTISSMDGTYEISFDEKYNVLVYSFVGMGTQEIEVGSQSTIDVKMESGITEIEGAVITALGISREKKSLGYSTQEVSGDDLNTVKNENFVNSISGKVSGVQVKTNSNFGGSTNIIIRGTTSLTGDNQALFVIDGVPVNNSNTNASSQRQGGSGYDYGSAVSDINPDDIESINVLKGAAATALYGSRAANGVIIITTKKGNKVRKGEDAIGITLSSSVTMGIIDKSTFPEYQTGYGAGYGPYYSGGDHPGLFEHIDFDGDGNPDLSVPTTEDASYGEQFDENLMVYQWTSSVPEHEDYGKATPWVNGAKGPIDFFNNAYTFRNSVAVDGGSEKGSYRVSYTNTTQTGIMPNSKLTRNNLSVSGSHEFGKGLTVSSNVNYMNTLTTGRNSTGYSNNILSSYRQWWQTNIDIADMESLYMDLPEGQKRNVTWNPHSLSDGTPEYWDNFYWSRYENYTTDVRDRILGNVQADWKITDYLSILGRASVDYYSSIQEERLAVGSTSRRWGISRLDAGSGYSRYNYNFRETNFDIMANFTKNLTKDLSLNAIVGWNVRRTNINTIYASTNGGLVVPQLYAVSNSINPVNAPVEGSRIYGVDGIYASASLGYKNFLYVDATIRRDHASTLPEESSSYFYPSVAASYIFSQHLKADWLSFGKVRVNYAEVGNSAPFASIYDVYSKPSPFGSTPMFSVPSVKNNINLMPERTKSIEAGIEMMFLQKRVGFDFAVYKTNTIDQILPVSVSTATGYSYKYVNSGEIENKGIELAVFATPMRRDNFSWDVRLNFSKNTNEVLSLYDDVDNLVLGSYQGGITINATVGEAYGTIKGTDYVYVDPEDRNSDKIINGNNGRYLRSAKSDETIGNITPDFNMGLTNTFTFFKNFRFSFLLDWQKGGSVFSLDHWYGDATGLYKFSEENNDLGNPRRDPIVLIDPSTGDHSAANIDPSSGGIINSGVIPVLDAAGNPTGEYEENAMRIRANWYGTDGYGVSPNARFVYDASYLKLREMSLTYVLPKEILGEGFFKGASFSLVGSNIWIIFKNLPDADPEAGLSSGNLQGFQSGVMPTTRNFGFNVNLQF
ncbi:MAG: SusC/RagA family TonB-linked outer membrane protein [Bacteroidetes bacterium]|nr:MAG: SusC/RagA family TonB-linked outer membrane protein [Bacteroidota bacterium]